MSLKTFSVALLFSLALVFFLDRGPYRALSQSRTGDFATVYAASRCWLHGENPYNRLAVHQELINSGAPPPLIREQDQHASLYLITAMPVLAVFAWLPWTAANVAWCLFSLACFAASLLALLRHLPLSTPAGWIAAGICLFFSPTYVGVLNGNPSVVSISLTILALHFALQQRPRVSGLLLAVTLCLKPQIALCSVIVLLVWKYWTPLLLGAAAAALISILAVLQASSFGQNFVWWISLRQALAEQSAPGGLVDPRPASPYSADFLNSQTLSYLLTPNSRLAEALVLLLLAALVAIYKRDARTSWIDVTFAAAVTLAITYHRYYDAQLLLVAVPATVLLWQSGRIQTASVLALCFALVAFPLQSIFYRALGPAATHTSLAHLVLLRHQPIAILVIALVLSLDRSVRKSK